MDPVEALIRRIHDRVHEIGGYAGDQRVELAIGNLGAAAHGKLPRIAWIELGGQLDMAPSKADGIEIAAAVLTQRPRLLVQCWHHDLERARALMFHAIAACHSVPCAEAIFDREYECPSQSDGRHTHGSALITFHVSLAVEIPIDTEHTRKVVTLEDAELASVSVTGD